MKVIGSTIRSMEKVLRSLRTEIVTLESTAMVCLMEEVNINGQMEVSIQESIRMGKEMEKENGLKMA